VSARWCFTITLFVVGPHRVWNYGGVGTTVMLVGAFLATDATWYYDQVRADFPTLKTRKAA